MTTLSDELERMHKRLDSAMGPFTLMMGRRKMSIGIMQGVLKELEDSLIELRNFVEKYNA